MYQEFMSATPTDGLSEHAFLCVRARLNAAYFYIKSTQKQLRGNLFFLIIDCLLRSNLSKIEAVKLPKCQKRELRWNSRNNFRAEWQEVSVGA